MFSFLRRFHLHPHFLDIDHALVRLLKTKLWLQILIGLFCGVGVGVWLHSVYADSQADTLHLWTQWLSFPGQIFLTMIQMIIVPLIIASVILGVGASENLQQLRRMGGRIVFYFLMTTSIAIVIGVGTASVIRPGSYIDQSFVRMHVSEVDFATADTSAQGVSWASIPTAIVNILPQNPTESIVKKDMLQIVLFSLIFGVALVSISSTQSKPLYAFFEGVQAVTLKIVHWVMMIAPLAVFGLMAQIIAQTGVQAFAGIGLYMATVIIGLLLLLIVYMLLVFFVGKRNPLTVLGHIREAQLLAFSTSSSAAVMPVSLKIAIEKLKIKPSIAEFLIPLGATINMDGTALYQGVAAVFLSQVFQMDLSLLEMGIILITSIGASIGTPATPGVGIVILSTVLSSVGIPPSGIALIIGVDRILDMCRTTINTTGDLVACIVIDKIMQQRTKAQRVWSKLTSSLS